MCKGKFQVTERGEKAFKWKMKEMGGSSWRRSKLGA